MKVLITIFSMLLLSPALSYAQGEYDDLYYTPEDRETDRKNYQAKVSYADQNSFRSSNIEDYEITTPSITSDRIYNTSQGRTVNPEYVAQYRSRAEARKQGTQQDEEVYFEENYATEYYDDDNNARVVNNHYYGSSWANPYYDPFYVNDWRWRYNDWRWRRSSWYYDPYWSYAPGWSINVSIGFGHRWGGYYGHRWSRWSYDPWYSPYYAGGYYYNSFYDPYWVTPVYSNVYYNKVVYVNNNESNNRIRRGPGTSRGSVISGRSGVAERGPVRRGTRASSADGDRNGRISTSNRVTSGRVIDRTGATTRSPRDYSDVEDRYIDRNSRTGTSATQPRTRSIETRSSERTSPAVNRTRSNTNRGGTFERTTPSRGTTTSPARTNSGNNRTYTPSRSNTRTTTPPARNNSRSTTPSRRGGNDQSYSPSKRSSGSPSYSAPQQRSSQPSYRSSGSSSNSSRSTTVSPSRSSSSSSGTRSSSGGSRSSSSRRGGN